MKKLNFILLILLIGIPICTLVSCSKETKWVETSNYNVEVIYQAESYIPTVQYMLTLKHLRSSDELLEPSAKSLAAVDIFSPSPYTYEYVLINSDLSVAHTEQEPSDKEKKMFLRMKEPIGPDEIRLAKQKWNSLFHQTTMVEPQKSKSIESTWYVSHSISLDTGYCVAFGKAEDSKYTNYLAEVALDRTILRIIRFDGLDETSLITNKISVRIDD